MERRNSASHKLWDRWSPVLARVFRMLLGLFTAGFSSWTALMPPSFSFEDLLSRRVVMVPLVLVLESGKASLLGWVSVRLCQSIKRASMGELFSRWVWQSQTLVFQPQLTHQWLAMSSTVARRSGFTISIQRIRPRASGRYRRRI